MTKKEVLNARYRLDSFSFQLENGLYKFPSPHGEAETEEEETEFWSISLDKEYIAIGDLNGDKKGDAAAILCSWTGGTGQFYDLAVLLNKKGEPAFITHIHLGDRIGITHFEIRDNKILLDLVVQGPSDPLCCPTEQKHAEYVLEGDHLNAIPSTLDTAP